MYLSILKLWNFRKFGSGSDKLNLDKPDAEINFVPGLNALIGENDSGKTAIIDAIKLILDTHSSEWVKIACDDFYEKSNRLRIECCFNDLIEEEAKYFTEWIGIKDEGGASLPYLRVILDAVRQEERILPFDIRAGVSEDGSRLNAEAREYLKVTYLKPLRDAKSELMPRKGSRLSQILFGHEAFKDKDNDHWLVKEVFDKFNTEIEAYFKEAKGGDNKGMELKNKLEDYLEKFFGQKRAANFLVAKKNLKEILEVLKLELSEEQLGLGSHNLLFIATELLNLERYDWNGLRLGLIEELEAHLHPQAQLKIIGYLQELTLRPDNRVQLILTTHSPNLGSRVNLENQIICNGGKIFSMGHNYTQLEISDYKFLERFLDVTKANLFFAKGIILVEGWAEELMLPILAQKIDCDLTKNGVSIINVASTAFLRYAKIFQRKNTDEEMNIPVSVITDLDIEPKDENIKDEGVIKTRAELKKETKKQKFDGQKVKTFISPHWTLEYCLSMSDSVKQLFFDSVKKVHPGIDEVNIEAGIEEKLIKGTLKKAEIAQIFSEELSKSSITASSLENDQNIEYLIKAIKYATGKD